MKLLRPGVRIHFVGIGGIGLSAVARVLRDRGYQVSGSDLQSSSMTDALTAEGIAVTIGHRSDNVARLAGPDGSSGVLVVISSAIPDGNPEVAEARRRGFPVVKRRQLLGELTAGKKAIAVAGTHGKTTTTAMIAWILVEAGLKPTFVVGGILQNLNTNAAAGDGPHFAIEADEYDRAFLGLRPDVAVLLSAEHDHPDCYPTWEAMRLAFADFTDRIVPGGQLIVCGDDVEALGLGKRAASREPRQGAEAVRLITYGLGAGWDWHAAELQLQGCPAFSVQHGGSAIGSCALQLPGEHSVLNALAALAATAALGVDVGESIAALTRFRGTSRRFEIKGQAAGITVVDDYAHHPTEIRATLRATRARFLDRPIWAVFQPHTFSRTAVLLDDFAAAFGDADHVLVTSIYAAREENTYGVSAADLVARIRSHKASIAPSESRPDVQHVESLNDAVSILLDQVRPGDVVVTLSAGDGNLVGERLLWGLGEEVESRAGSEAVLMERRGTGTGADTNCDGHRTAGTRRNRVYHEVP